MLIDLAILRFEVDHPEPARDSLAALSRELNGLLDEVRGIEQGQGPYWCYSDALRLVFEGRADRSKARFELATERLAAARQVLPTWSRIAFLAGWIHELQARPDDAVAEYLRAAELGDRQPQLFERLVKLLYQRKEYQRADQFLRELHVGNDPELARLAAEISFLARDLERAALYAQQLAQGSGDFKDYIFWGLMLEANGRMQEAEDQLRQATRLGPEQPEPWVALIDFLGRRGRTPDAEHAVDEAVANVEPREAPLALARAYESLGRDEDAGLYYEQALQSSPGDARIARMAAAFRLRRGEARLAEPVLQRIVQQERPPQDAADVDWAHRALARIMAQPGRPYQDFQTALSLIDRNLRQRGNALEDRIAKAWVLSQGRTADTRQDAIRVFEDIQASEGRLNPPDRFRLGQLQLEQGNWSAVTRLMRELLSATPDRNQARELGAYKQYVEWYIFALLQRNETSEASIWVERLNQLLPNELDSVLARAHILVAEGRVADALGVCQRFLDDRAADVAPQQVWIVGRRLELIAAGLPSTPQSPDAALFERAEAYFRDYVERQPDEVLELAAFLGRRGRADEALELMHQHIERSGPVQVVKASVAVMGAVAGDQERLERLESLLQASQTAHPDSIELRLTYADLRGWLGRDDAGDLYREILARDAENVIALNNLALLLALQATDPEEAQRLIERAIEIGGPSAPLLDTRATVRLRRSRPEEALTDLQAAVREARDPVYLIHQAQAHLALGQKREAREAWLSARSEGIREQRLHPLERESYREFAAAME
jgi:tetratricopeptide (TPR) repeat protein